MAKTLQTLKIVHSCDPPNQATLYRWSRGQYTPRKAAEAFYPIEARIPKRYGPRVAYGTWSVLRCQKGNCIHCRRTRTHHSGYNTRAELKTDHDFAGERVEPIYSVDFDAKVECFGAVEKWVLEIPEEVDLMPPPWSQPATLSPSEIERLTTLSASASSAGPETPLSTAPWVIEPLQQALPVVGEYRKSSNERIGVEIAQNPVLDFFSSRTTEKRELSFDPEDEMDLMRPAKIPRYDGVAC